VQKTEAQMLKYKNFGKKSLSEISGILTGMGLALGMNIEEHIKGKKALPVPVVQAGTPAS
jgi:DNA-directed RNA polymerase subunit alpha